MGLGVTILILFTGTLFLALYYGFAPVSMITPMLHNHLFILILTLQEEETDEMGKKSKKVMLFRITGSFGHKSTFTLS